MHGSRRQFLKRSSLAAAGLGLAGSAETFPLGRPTVAPSDRIRIATIGTGGMGER